MAGNTFQIKPQSPKAALMFLQQFAPDKPVHLRLYGSTMIW